jgi:DNA-binding NarL/FixJ family response regulator
MTLLDAPPAPRQHGTDLADGCRAQRVLVVDEHEVTSAGLRAVLADLPWVESCLVASSADAALRIARRHHPQIILISASLGGRSGPELCCTLKEQTPHIKVVLMSGEGRIPAELALSLGAASALSKHMSIGAITSLVKQVAEGARVFPKAPTPAPSLRLSRRESDVLQHLAAGLSNPEMAIVLNLSRHTVKQHTSAVYRKLGVRNRAEAASRAHGLGLLAWKAGSREQARAG